MLIESEGERKMRGLALVPWFAAQELLPNVDWGQSGSCFKAEAARMDERTARLGLLTDCDHQSSP